ncbi:MAG: hypothetical protein ACOX2G_05055 [Bacillota bacterium]|jgi:hypothetical protein
MRSKIYIAGIIGVVVLLALGFQILPSPWQGGTAGWFSALWYLVALAAGLGYWHKFDQAKAKEEREKALERARKARARNLEKKRRTRARAY